MEDSEKKYPQEDKKSTIARNLLQVASGFNPLGGILSAAASAWSENEQTRVNDFFQAWLKMLEDEIKEKGITLIEILQRLDLQDQKIAVRLESKEYQSLLKKTFREWAGAENEEKRIYIRNILANAAASTLTSDDVIRLFIDWLKKYSELHFQVIGVIYNNGGISRGEIWRRIGKSQVREDSAEAGLYRLLIRDLNMGGIIRQHREKDVYGNFLQKKPQKRASSSSGRQKTMESAFDENDLYELSELGEQFVHYAMTDLPLKIEFSTQASTDQDT